MVIPFTRVTRNTITITITISLHTHTHTTHTEQPADAELASAESTIQEELKKHTQTH